jgi:hypothetical protein
MDTSNANSYKQDPLPKTEPVLDDGHNQAFRQDDKPIESGNIACSNKLMDLQYREIGETLLACEVACLSVGIPWIPPSSRARKASELFYTPIDEFVRVQLCNVSTKTLESYCDDLAFFALDVKSSEALHISISDPVERHGYSLLVGFLLFLTLLSLMLFFSTSISTALGLSLGFGGCASLLASTYCGEQQRRETFQTLLQKELLRRKGQDQSSNKNIKLLSVDIEPL